MHMFAEALSTKEFDPYFLGQFIQIVIMGGGLLAIWRAMARKPPIAEDLVAMQRDIAAVRNSSDETRRQMQALPDIRESFKNVHHQLTSITRRMEVGDECISDLRERQSANSARIEDIQRTVHEMRADVNQAVATAINARAAAESIQNHGRSK